MLRLMCLTLFNLLLQTALEHKISAIGKGVAGSASVKWIDKVAKGKDEAIGKSYYTALGTIKARCANLKAQDFNLSLEGDGAAGYSKFTLSSDVEGDFNYKLDKIFGKRKYTATLVKSGETGNCYKVKFPDKKPIGVFTNVFDDSFQSNIAIYVRIICYLDYAEFATFYDLKK
jgi:hypothetical protein